MGGNLEVQPNYNPNLMRVGLRLMRSGLRSSMTINPLLPLPLPLTHTLTLTTSTSPPSIIVSMLHSLLFNHSPDGTPLPPPSAALPYTQHPLYVPWFRKTPNPDPNPASNSSHSYCQTRRLLLTLLLILALTLTKCNPNPKPKIAAMLSNPSCNVHVSTQHHCAH